MDEIFAAIAAYLRERNPRLTVERAPVERVWRDSLRPWRPSAGPMVYCRCCGRAILSGEGLFDLEKLREDRACAEHYIPF